MGAVLSCDCFAGVAAAATGGSSADKTLHLKQKPSVIDTTVQKKLLASVKSNDFQTVKSLIESGTVDVDWGDPDFFNYTALHLSSASGRDDIVRYLLTNNYMRANIDPRSTSDETPLIMAARGKYKETCRILLDNGANTELKTNYKGNLARSAAEYLKELGWPASFE